MRIVIDGRMLGWTGVGRYTNRLLTQLEKLDHEDDYVVLMLTKDRELWQPTAKNFSVAYADILPYTLAEQLRLPGVIRQLKPDLVHFTHFSLPLFYNAPFVVTVHDIILVEHKNFRGDGLKRWLYEVKYVASRLVLSHAVRRAKLVFTPTVYTRDRLAQMFKLPETRLTATILGVDKLAEVAAEVTVKEPYIFSLGNSYPYKNLDRLVDAFTKTKFRANGGKLVLGGQDDYFGQKLRARVKELGLDKAVLFPGRVSDAELAGLYKHAQLYVYPSLAEGFGLQSLEAMQYGLPVLSSDASCLPEIGGDAAEYFSPLDVEQLTAKIDDLMTDAARREELVKLGYARVKRFSWKAMAEKTLAAYRVVGRG